MNTWKKSKNFKESLNDFEDFLLERLGFENINDLDNPKIYPLFNLDKAVEIINKNKEKKIVVVTDYDVDGVMSSVILNILLSYLKCDFKIIVPNRYDGYGLSEKTIEKIGKIDNVKLLITADNGIASVEPIDELRKKGIGVIVLDHHLPREDGKIPDAVVVDPHAHQEDRYKDYCGAGICMRLSEEFNLPNHLMKQIKIYAMLATIADMMPLLGHNRLIVKEGLKLINNPLNLEPALAFILMGMNLEFVTEKDVGFAVAPVINAAGRMLNDGARKIFEYFIETDLEKLRVQAEYFVEVNNDRKRYVKNAVKKIELKNDIEKMNPIIIYEPDLLEGVVGIIAGKCSEKYGRASIVLTDSKESGIIKGSGRSNSDNLKEFLDQNKEFFKGYGGHAAACGLSMSKENFEKFVEKTKMPIKDDKKSPEYDFKISYIDILKAYKKLRDYSPYGMGISEPVFLIQDINIVPRCGKTHFYMGEDKDHIKIFGQNVSILKFFLDENIVFKSNKINSLGYINKNIYRGKEEFVIESIDLEFKEKNNEKSELLKSLNSLITDF